MDIYQQTQEFFQSVNTPKQAIGKTAFGREIYAVRCGHGLPVGIATYAIHGREFITAKLAFSHFFTGVFGSVWLLPLVNPDGALLSQIGLSSTPENEWENLLSINGKNTDFSLWKANGRGVDLNVNFDAEWGKGKSNVFAPAPENYVGKAAFSEMESRALKEFTLAIRPDYTISYHTKGEEIYWYFGQDEKREKRDKGLAQVLSKATMYPLKQTFGSVGGYKDWCIQALQIPAFTVEVGEDKWAHPLKDNAFLQIEERNKFALRKLSQAVQKIGKL